MVEPNFPEGLDPEPVVELLARFTMFYTGIDADEDEIYEEERTNLYYLFLEERNALQQKRVLGLVQLLREYYDGYDADME